MAGLKGLKKQDKALSEKELEAKLKSELEQQADDFIAGAQEKVDAISPEAPSQKKAAAKKKAAPKKLVTKKVLINISEKMDRDVVRLSNSPTRVNVPKSAVFRAGILALKELDKKTLDQFLERAIELD